MKVREIICLNLKNSVNSCENACSLSFFQIFFIRAQIFHQNLKLISLESFDNKSMVIGKEKKASTSSCLASSTFTRLKHLILIYFYPQWLEKCLGWNIILLLNLIEYFIIYAFDFKLNRYLQRILYLSILILCDSCFLFIFGCIVRFNRCYISNIFNLKINIGGHWLLIYFYIVYLNWLSWITFLFFFNSPFRRLWLWQWIFYFFLIFNQFLK